MPCVAPFRRQVSDYSAPNELRLLSRHRCSFAKPLADVIAEVLLARILIANDDPDLLATCQDVLEGAGHSVRAVVSGAVAVAEARDWRPDGILVDWIMPDMDGGAAIRALRQDPATTSIPILMMSGSRGGADAAARAGANAFLAKPFGAADLVSAIEMLVALASTTSPVV
jgi:CheY-like chemotaxis protein